VPTSLRGGIKIRLSEFRSASEGASPDFSGRGVCGPEKDSQRDFLLLFSKKSRRKKKRNEYRGVLELLTSYYLSNPFEHSDRMK